MYLKDSMKSLQLAGNPIAVWAGVERALKANGSPLAEGGLLYVMLKKEEKAVRSR